MSKDSSSNSDNIHRVSLAHLHDLNDAHWRMILKDYASFFNEYSSDFDSYIELIELMNYSMYCFWWIKFSDTKNKNLSGMYVRPFQILYWVLAYFICKVSTWKVHLNNVYVKLLSISFNCLHFMSIWNQPLQISVKSPLLISVILGLLLENLVLSKRKIKKIFTLLTCKILSRVYRRKKI